MPQPEVLPQVTDQQQLARLVQLANLTAPIHGVRPLGAYGFSEDALPVVDNYRPTAPAPAVQYTPPSEQGSIYRTAFAGQPEIDGTQHRRRLPHFHDKPAGPPLHLDMNREVRSHRRPPMWRRRIGRAMGFIAATSSIVAGFMVITEAAAY